jgi:hypothetical protein
MKSWLRTALLLSALLFLTVGVASADTLITYQFTGVVSASFELPVNPPVIAFTPGFDFIVMPINLMINGVPSTDRLNFYNATGGGGGFVATNGGSTADINVGGPQLYTGPESSPTMLGIVAGGVTLTDFMTGATVGTLTSPGTPGPVSTPEPSITILLAIGLLALGLTVLRFKPNLVVSAS